MKIKVIYFAALREQAKKNDEIIETSFTNPADIYNLLKKKYNFTLEINNLKVAVNDCYENFDFEIKEMDSLVFIPPVAGG
ncbi:MAG: molybdopterin synthase sulfur carrier subunit [Ignavibacteriales bacterium CG12_big_fil_rev_8_21_14_0_65_30_8]|nr:MAG: molybdopterin synthase sulfur carrier subunit [Ignavibacteriales bacterium CG12_big_fil_rev_8_21_14_0_65_30_8]